MRILLADDQMQVRSALRLVLEQEPDFQVVGETADATGLLRAVDRKNPDIVLLDWELPGLGSKQLLRLLHLGFPNLKVLVMSTQPQAAHQAIAAGAHAFLGKSEPARAFLDAIRKLC